MDTILKFNLDELLRFLLSVLFVILSLRILFVPEAIENFQSFGVEDNVRMILGVGGLIGAGMFFVEGSALLGAVVLLLGLGYIMYQHASNGQGIAWLIVCAVGVCIMVPFIMKRVAMRKAGIK